MQQIYIFFTFINNRYLFILYACYKSLYANAAQTQCLMKASFYNTDRQIFALFKVQQIHAWMSHLTALWDLNACTLKILNVVKYRFLCVCVLCGCVLCVFVCVYDVVEVYSNTLYNIINFTGLVFASWTDYLWLVNIHLAPSNHYNLFCACFSCNQNGPNLVFLIYIKAAMLHPDEHVTQITWIKPLDKFIR